MSRPAIVFNEGCLWEEVEWKIRFDVLREKYDLTCRHCLVTAEGSSCPRVVIAKNEGGYNSTGVCLDCILEAAATLKEEK